MNSYITIVCLLISFFLAIISCQNSDSPTSISKSQQQEVSTSVNALSQKVMDIHDEAMAKMGPMHQLKKQLKKMVTEYSSNNDSIKTDSTFVEKAHTYIQDLEVADEAMMQWMREYEEPMTTSMTESESLQYLEKEEVKITKVAQQINQSIYNAETLLKQSTN